MHYVVAAVLLLSFGASFPASAQHLATSALRPSNVAAAPGAGLLTTTHGFDRTSRVAARGTEVVHVPEPSGRGALRYTVRGALIGATLGLTAGALIGSKVGVGCDAVARPGGSTCSSGRQRFSVVIGFGTTGLVVGGAAGAVLGTLVGAARPEGPR